MKKMLNQPSFWIFLVFTLMAKCVVKKWTRAGVAWNNFVWCHHLPDCTIRQSNQQWRDPKVTSRVICGNWSRHFLSIGLLVVVGSPCLTVLHRRMVVDCTGHRRIRNRQAYRWRPHPFQGRSWRPHYFRTWIVGRQGLHNRPRQKRRQMQRKLRQLCWSWRSWIWLLLSCSTRRTCR